MCGLVSAAIILLCCFPRLFAFEIRLFPASEVYDPDVDYLHERLGVNGQPMKIEEFEDQELATWLRTNLKAGDEETSECAWAGSRGSAFSNSAEFEIHLPKIRLFGIGLGDNDGGNEQISVNGNPPIQLNRLPGHEGNGIGRAFYALVIAQPNDADIRSVVIDQCFTVSFDHLIVLEDKELREEQKLIPRLVLSLVDGTRLVGYSPGNSIAVSVQGINTDLAFERISSMQFQNRTSQVTVLLKNGEKLSCEPKFVELKLSTVLGEISVPREKIRQLKVTPRGEFRPDDARPERLKRAFGADEPSYEAQSLRTWLAMRRSRPRVGSMYNLLAAEADAESADQQMAKKVIRKIGTAAVPFLVEMVSHGDEDSRLAVEGFAALGDLAKQALPDLLLLLDEPADVIQYGSIVRSIGHIGLAAKDAIPLLLEELRWGRYPTVVAEALGNIGSAASDAVPIMIAKLSTGDLPHDLPLIEALGKIGSADAVPVLLAIAQGSDSCRKPEQSGFAAEMRKHRAVDALGKIGPSAEAAVPGLIGLLKHTYPGNMAGYSFSDRLIRTLGAVGPAAHEAIPLLREVAEREKSSQISSSAALALTEIQPTAVK